MPQPGGDIPPGYSIITSRVNPVASSWAPQGYNSGPFSMPAQRCADD